MDKDKISAFTLRIASANSTEIISVLFDIYDAYEEDGIKAFEENRIDDGIKAVQGAAKVVNHLQKDLNFDYKISNQLNSLYDFVQRSLSKSIYKANVEGILEARVVMKSLGEAFEEIAKKDNSKPVMRNTQRVVAGFTYGRNSLNESMVSAQTNRGFLA